MVGKKRKVEGNSSGSSGSGSSKSDPISLTSKPINQPLRQEMPQNIRSGEKTQMPNGSVKKPWPKKKIIIGALVFIFAVVIVLITVIIIIYTIGVQDENSMSSTIPPNDKPTPRCINAEECLQKCGGNCQQCQNDCTTCKCTGCKPGFYRNNRRYECAKCSANCRENDCYDWEERNTQKTGDCKECNPGRWADRCQTKCPNNCMENDSCRKQNGTCANGCKKGFYGDKCYSRCSAHCIGDLCEQSNGKCLYGCNQGYYGEENRCTKCSAHCRGICEKSDGNCPSGCKDGYYGDRCDKRCSHYCKADSCEQSTGNCSGGCTINRYGDACQQICSQYCQHVGTGSSCYQDTGYCKKCVRGKGDRANGCKEKCYVPNCEICCDTFSENTATIERLPDYSYEVPLYGCDGTFTGRNCEKCNENLEYRSFLTRHVWLQKLHENVFFGEGVPPLFGACIPVAPRYHNFLWFILKLKIKSTLGHVAK